MQPQPANLSPSTQVCKGKTRLGKSCARTANLNEEGYCYQHADQGEGAQEAQVTQVAQVVQEAPLQAPAPAAAPAPAPEPPSTPGSESIQDIEEVPHHASSSSSSEETSKHLERCQAISKSTNQQCKHHVSFSGEKFCPTHNGKQKSPKSPQHEQCQAIAHRTKKRCEKRVRNAGDKFCTIHASKASSAPSSPQQVSSVPPTPPLAAALSTLDLGPFQAALTQHMLNSHQNHGQCTPGTRCKTFRLIQACQEFVKKQSPAHTNMMAHWVSMLQHMDPPHHQQQQAGGPSPTQPMPPSPVEEAFSGGFPFDLDDPTSFMQSLRAVTPMVHRGDH